MLGFVVLSQCADSQYLLLHIVACFAMHCTSHRESLHCWMPDVHTAINMAGPIFGPWCPPPTMQVSHETAPDFLNGHVFSSMDMFFPPCVLPGTEMTGGDLHLKEREIRNWPRSLNFPPNIRENPPSSRSSRSPHFFHGNWSIIWADSLQRSNMLK